MRGGFDLYRYGFCQWCCDGDFGSAKFMDIYFWDAGVLSLVYQRVPFISDPRVESVGARSDGDSVLQTWVQMPVDQIDFGFQMIVIRVQAEASTLCLETHSLTSHVASFAS